MKSLKKNNVLIVILFAIALFMSVGFAVLSTTLNINGQAVVKSNTWDIHFENVAITEGSVTAIKDAVIANEAATLVEYEIALEKPGDYYEFTVDAVNDGTLDSMIEMVTLSGIEGHEEYINYQVTYLDGTEIKEEDSLNSKETKTYKVKVEYKKDIEKLLEEDIKLNLVFGVTYSQAKNGEFVNPVCDYAKGTEWTFAYTGNIQEFEAPCDGTYKLEVWGAKGGSTGKAGGSGGYSIGNIVLSEQTNLYIGVGGQGTKSYLSTVSTIAGGYNGGGNGRIGQNVNGGTSGLGSGGGATHIAINNNRGELYNYDLYREEVLIVAGGGGGASVVGAWTESSGYYHSSGLGYAGGGLTGVGTNAGTQTSGAAFGKGSTAGGGGWYGGGSRSGGSGYIDGVIDGETIAGNLEMPTHDGTSTMTGNTGDGYAKITLMSY